MPTLNYTFEFSDVINSTHAKAVQKMFSTNFGRHFCIGSAYQTEGKGQFGRVWQAEPGSSALFSIGIQNIALNSKQVQVLPFFFAICCLQAIQSNEVQIKWPNDLYAKSRKLGGLLIETKYSGNTLSGIILSAGINLEPSAYPIDIQGISCEELGLSFEIQELIVAICDNVFEQIVDFHPETIIHLTNKHLFGRADYLPYTNGVDIQYFKFKEVLLNGHVVVDVRSFGEKVLERVGEWQMVRG